MVTDNGINIHLSEDMAEQLRKRGHRLTGNAMAQTIIKWQGFLNNGERELTEALTVEEIDAAEHAIAIQIKADALTHKEFWGMSAERLAAIVAMRDKKLGERMVRLGELAAIALKERVEAVVVFPPGTGGRTKKK